MEIHSNSTDVENELYRLAGYRSVCVMESKLSLDDGSYQVVVSQVVSEDK
jgi:hypothetical protein